MEGERKSDKIIVSWGKEKIPLEFDNNNNNKDDIDDKKERRAKQEQVQESGGSLEKTTLKQLKERLKKITGVPLNGQKIIFSGAVMKDESATLGSFGLHHNSKIMLIGSKPNANDLAATSTNSSEEHALIQKITQLLHKSKTTLIPQIESFETSVKSFLGATSSSSSSSSSSSPPPSTSTPLPSPSNNNNNDNNNSLSSDDANLKTKLQDMHHYIVENLMQSLLVLDGIDFSSNNSSQEFTIARQKRRDAVKFTQQLIDRVDEVKEKLLKANIINSNSGGGGGGILEGTGTGVGIAEDGNVERQNVEGEN